MSKTHFADDETLAYIAKLEAELERMRGHAETSQCGFDRNGSHSAGRYVCACGWIEAKLKEKNT